MNERRAAEKGRPAPIERIVVGWREGCLPKPGACAASPARISSNQYESALMTSPPPIVPRARQVTKLMVSLMNRTEPSAKTVFTPPGW